MNIVLIAVIIIILICAVIGLRRGLIRTVFSLVSMILAIILTIFISPYVSKWMRSNDTIMNYFSERVEKTLTFDDEKNTSKNKEEIIVSLDLPDFIEDVLIDNNNGEMYNALKVQKDNVKQYVITSVACIVINAAAFIATFLLVRILLWLLCFLLDIMSKLPVVKQINKLLGFFLGIFQGLIYIWLFCILLMMFGSGEIGTYIYGAINESEILTFIYDSNLVLRIVTDFTKLLYLVV